MPQFMDSLRPEQLRSLHRLRYVEPGLAFYVSSSVKASNPISSTVNPETEDGSGQPGNYRSPMQFPGPAF